MIDGRFVHYSGPEMGENCLDVYGDRLGMDLERLRIDHRAVDTVSNFTTLAQDVKDGGFKHIAILTSKNHVSWFWLVLDKLVG